MRKANALFKKIAQTLENQYALILSNAKSLTVHTAARKAVLRNGLYLLLSTLLISIVSGQFLSSGILLSSLSYSKSDKIKSDKEFQTKVLKYKKAKIKNLGLPTQEIINTEGNSINSVEQTVGSESTNPLEPMESRLIKNVNSISSTENFGDNNGKLTTEKNFLLLPPDCACGPNCSSGQLGGQVWEDYNQDGIKSSVEKNGVAGVSVTAYDCNGVAYGPVTTSACGYYTFGATIASNKYPVRLEFSNIPSDYQNSTTFNGTNSRTSVQKISAATCNANLGVADPREYCQNNPRIAVPQYINGDPLPTTIGTSPCIGTAQNPASNAPTLVSFPSNQTGTFPNPSTTTFALASQTGGVWGMAYQKKSKSLFSSAVVKRHVGLGTLGLGGIYITNTATNVTTNFLKVSDLGINVGNDANFKNNTNRSLPEERTCPNADKAGFDNVGKLGIGDLDISDDGSRLFFVNLLDRKVYAINIDPVNPSAATSSLYGSWAVPNTCGNAGDNRPWGLTYHQGKVYVGTVCSQESTQSASGLKATVFEINENAPGSTPTQVLQFPLTYTKGYTLGACSVAQSQWKPWTLQFPNPCSNNWIIYPQPILSDIEFDTNGDMIIGFIDRTGFQTGDENFSPNPENGIGNFNGLAGGDILRAQFNGNGSNWTIENNGTVSCVTTSGAGNGQGPGGGEYYFGDFSLFGQNPNSAWHNDAMQGALAMNPADGKIIVNGIDPSGDAWTGGVWQINNATGVRDNGYAVYKKDPGTFGKASGLGDIEALCDLPPLQIGNYVWRDTDNDGVQDACESGIAGVNVALYNASGTLISTKITDANGEYYFSTADGLQPETKYFVVVGTGGQFSAGKLNVSGANVNLSLTRNDTGEGANPDLNDSDGSITPNGAVPNNAFTGLPSVMLMTGQSGNVNHTFDFGFGTCTLSASATKAEPKCEQSNGSATANGSGGVMPYTYKWSNGATTQTANNLGAGAYTVTITDAVLCTATASVTLINQASPTVSITKNDATCDVNNGSATATPNGGAPAYSYKWSNGPTSQTINNLAPGSYSVTVTDQNGCTAIGSITIINFPKPTVTIAKVDAKCELSNGSATANPSGGTAGYTYKWSNGPTTQTITNLAPGNYTVTVTDSKGCTGTASTLINNTSSPTVTASKVDPTCGFSNGSASASPAGGTPGYSYKWSNGPTTQNITGLAPGTYTVTVTDQNGCTAVASTTLSNVAGPSVTVSKVDATCDVNNGSATANPSGGAPGYGYKWSNGPTTQTINNLAPGSYSVTVTDQNGCTAIGSITIINFPKPTVTIAKVDAKCELSNGSATANPSGGTAGYTYKWSNGPTTQTITNLAPGNYTVTVTDSKGCTGTASITINNIPSPTVTATKVDPTCGFSNGSASASPAGGSPGYTYKWSSGQTTQNISGLSPGSYTVTVTDAQGCTATATVNLSNITGPSLTVVKVDALCDVNNGSATANPTAGTPNYTYIWSNGQNTQTINGLGAGTYTVTVTDANGCVAVGSATVINFPKPIVTISKVDAKCEQNNGSATANPSSGTPGYTYKWSNGPTTQTINNLSPGSYTVTVTDSKACTNTATILINNIPSPTVTISKVDALCDVDNGSATANPSGGTPGYTYKWSNGSLSQTINNLAPGTYTVTITDQTGCTAVASTTLINFPKPTGTISKVDAKCELSNGSATANPVGGTPGYTYKWSNSATTQTINNLAPGSYAVTITDSKGCTVAVSVNIVNIPSPTVSISKQDALCDVNNGSATANPVGGTPGYTYKWSNGPTSQTIANLAPGTYTVTVTDQTGCTAVTSTTIINFPKPTGTISKVDAKCELSNGTATANPSGGTPGIYISMV
jgi:uncharacterized protein (DUF2141 family)